MNPRNPSAMDKVVPQLFYHKKGFGIKSPTEVDMPLNKENKNVLHTSFIMAADVYLVLCVDILYFDIYAKHTFRFQNLIPQIFSL